MRINLTSIGEILRSLGTFLESLVDRSGQSQPQNTPQPTPPSKGIQQSGRVIQSSEIKQSPDAKQSPDIKIESAE